MKPKYIDCRNEEVEHCEYYLEKDCRESCAYAIEQKEIFIGSVVDWRHITSRENLRIWR